jgi:hypothetical protein
VVASLPKTPTEKVRKHLLRDDHGSYDVWDRQATPDVTGT